MLAIVTLILYLKES